MILPSFYLPVWLYDSLRWLQHVACEYGAVLSCCACLSASAYVDPCGSSADPRHHSAVTALSVAMLLLRAVACTHPDVAPPPGPDLTVLLLL